MSEHSTPIENIWLMREGGENETGYAVVYVQRDGVWYEAIRELNSGSFSHCISSHGLVDDRCCKPASWLNKKQQAVEGSS